MAEICSHDGSPSHSPSSQRDGDFVSDRSEEEESDADLSLASRQRASIVAEGMKQYELFNLPAYQPPGHRQSTGSLPVDESWMLRWKSLLKRNADNTYKAFMKGDMGRRRYHMKYVSPWWRRRLQFARTMLPAEKLVSCLRPMRQTYEDSAAEGRTLDSDLEPEDQSRRYPMKGSPSTFKHIPLMDPRKEIRLLLLKSGPIHQPIEMELSTWDLTLAPSFNAISYTWGEKSSCEILVDGRRMLVRQNCHYALWQSRLHYPGSYVWIDSICINQHDNGEKSHQVALMFDIFSTADRVLCCVGPHQDDSEFLACVTEDIDLPPDLLDLSDVDQTNPLFLPTSQWWTGWFKILGDRGYHQLRQSTFAFIDRSYWRRLWVVPEIVAASEVRLLCGSHDLCYYSLMSIIYAIRHADRPMCRDTGWRCPHIPRCWFAVNVPELDTAFRLRQDRARGSSKKIGSLLSDCKSHECSDPRDRLYALLPLAPSTTDIVPNYHMSTTDLFLILCRHLHIYEMENALEAFRIDHKNPIIQELVLERQRTKLTTIESEVPYPLVVVASVATFTCSRPRPLTLERLNALMKEGNLDGLEGMHDAIVQKSSSDELPVVEGDNCNIPASICPDALEGDLIVEFKYTPNDLRGIVLVLRHSYGQVYDVVGQGYMLWTKRHRPRYKHGNKPTHNADTNHLIFTASLELRMSAEDMLLVLGQDRDTGRGRGYDVKARVQRPYTKPLASPEGAATITAMRDEAVTFMNQNFGLQIPYTEWLLRCEACGQGFMERPGSYGLDDHRKFYCSRRRSS